MQISVIAIGQKMPNWVETACQEYQKRLSAHWPTHLIEIPLIKRQKRGDNTSFIQKEGEKMLKKIPANAFCISLEITGKRYTTEAFAKAIDSWQSHHLCFLIGGPEGLSEICRQRADCAISLSDMTLPHPLARITLLEQLYRAWTINNNHPYHK